MTPLRRFNAHGIDAFLERLTTAVTHPDTEFEDLLDSGEFTEVVSDQVDVLMVNFVSRREAAEHAAQVLSDAKVHPTHSARDAGMWTWLAARWIDSLAPKADSGLRKVGGQWRWKPDLNSYRTYYRHLLLGPHEIYNLYRHDPDVAMCVLGSSASSPGEIVEQLASRNEVITNPNLITAATALYWDGSAGSLKPGSGGKGAGSPRRLVEVFQQFDRTWDFRETPVAKILDLLPQEFDRFQPKP